MTNSESEKTDGRADAPTEGISDDQLPEDLQPSEDNPLAEPLAEEDAPDDLADLEMEGGRTAVESDDGDGDSDAGDSDTGDDSSGED
ncbi:MAG: hypothetical protein JWN22_313 [Nocardioides sp.]|jgi:hypothetical protein|nr:hypothetical protein [Nocardioides sp.]